MEKKILLIFTLISLILFELPLYAQVSPGFQNHQFQYLTSALTSSSATSSVANAWNSIDPPKWYTLSAATTDTGWNVILEGSLDNVNWQQIAITTSAIGTVSNSVPMPALYFRLRAGLLPAGKNVTATAIGVW